MWPIPQWSRWLARLAHGAGGPEMILAVAVTSASRRRAANDLG
jgi:hypothetical protein